MQEIRFDDLSTLSSMVSPEWGNWSRPVAVSQDMVNAFAEMTGDRQWIHVDVDRARRESPFGESWVPCESRHLGECRRLSLLPTPWVS